MLNKCMGIIIILVNEMEVRILLRMSYAMVQGNYSTKGVSGGAEEAPALPRFNYNF